MDPDRRDSKRRVKRARKKVGTKSVRSLDIAGHIGVRPGLLTVTFIDHQSNALVGQIFWISALDLEVEFAAFQGLPRGWMELPHASKDIIAVIATQ